MDIRRLLAALLLSLCAAGAVFAAEKRVALVIGNDTYQDIPKLEKAASDARAVGQQLSKVGFEVMSYTNLGRREMNQAVALFVDKVAGGGVGVFFYAGHGVQAGGTNFLLPVDIRVKNEQDLIDEAIDMQRVLERLADAKAKLSVLVIDACRDNPFKKAHGRSIGATRGLAIPQAPSGTLVVYSAGIGQQALDKLADGDGNPNGLFTREFLPAIATPGLRIDEAVKKVRSAVIAKAKAVGHEQNPAIYDQTDGDFYFIAGAAPRDEPAAARGQQIASAVDPMAVEMSFWDSIRSSTDVEDFEEYLRQYPRGRFAGLARNRIKAMAQQAQRRPVPAQDADTADMVARVKGGDVGALRALRRAAEKGDATAQASLGRIYAAGWGVPRDDAEGMRWLRKAAEQRNADAQNGMGFMLAAGRGVARDDGAAVAWYRKAADQGHAKAQFHLAGMYAGGRGVAQDEVEALKWLRKAADQGEARAQTQLGLAYAAGVGTARDEAAAATWLRKGAEQGNDNAEFHLGRLYRAGVGVAKDEAEATKWFRLAAEKGNRQAQEALAAATASAPAPSAAPRAAREPNPKEFCADRPNFVSRGICERRECEKPRNAQDPHCEQYKTNNPFPGN